MYGSRGVRRAAYLTQALGRLLDRRWGVVYTRDLGVEDVALRFPARMRPPIVYESHGFAPTLAEQLPRMVSGASVSPAAEAQPPAPAGAPRLACGRGLRRDHGDNRGWPA